MGYVSNTSTGEHRIYVVYSDVRRDILHSPVKIIYYYNRDIMFFFNYS